MDVRGQDNFLIRNLAGSNGGTGVLVLGNGNNFQRNQGRSNDNDGVFGIGRTSSATAKTTAPGTTT